MGGGLARQKVPLATFAADISMLSSFRHSLWGLAGGVCTLGEVQGWCRKVQILCRAWIFVRVV